MRTRPGFTILEILIAVTVIAIAMLPILVMSQNNVKGAEMDRVRLVCEALCRSMLERFGEPKAYPVLFSLLTPGAGTLREAADLHVRLLEQAPQVDELRGLIAYHDIHSKLTLSQDVDPHLHLITAEVTWKVQRGARVREESIRYSRFIFIQ